MVETIKTPTAVIRVHRPELTPEEKARRMKSIEEAAVRLLIAAEKLRRKV